MDTLSVYVLVTYGVQAYMFVIRPHVVAVQSSAQVKKKYGKLQLSVLQESYYSERMHELGPEGPQLAGASSYSNVCGQI